MPQDSAPLPGRMGAAIPRGTGPAGHRMAAAIPRPRPGRALGGRSRQAAATARSRQGRKPTSRCRAMSAVPSGWRPNHHSASATVFSVTPP